MKTFATLFLVAISDLALASQWLGGGGGGGGGHNLVGVPGLDNYEHLEYPKYELQELGNEVKGEIPPKTVKVLKTISYKVPQPYPVHIPFKVPYPVTVEKPIPVVQTKIVKVSQPFPVPVEKPSEGFQPPSHESGDWSASFGGGGSSGGGYEQLQQSYGVPGQEPGAPLGGGDYPSYGGGDYPGSYGGGEDHGAEDRSVSYRAVEEVQAAPPVEGQQEGGQH